MYRICISVIRHFQRAGFPSRQLHGPDVYVGAVLVFAYWNVGSLGIWCCPLWRCLPLSCLCRKSFFCWPFLLQWFFISCMSAEFLFGIFESTDSAVHRRDSVSGMASCARYGRALLAGQLHFNLHIPDVYGGLVEKTKPEFYVVSALALCGCIYSLYRGNIYARIICLLWVFEALQRFFYFSLDRHYYYQLQIFNGMLAGTFAWEIIKNGGLQRMFCSIVAVRLFGL